MVEYDDQPAEVRAILDQVLPILNEVIAGEKSDAEGLEQLMHFGNYDCSAETLERVNDFLIDTLLKRMLHIDHLHLIEGLRIETRMTLVNVLPIAYEMIEETHDGQDTQDLAQHIAILAHEYGRDVAIETLGVLKELFELLMATADE